MPGVVDEIYRAHRAGRHGHFIFHAAKLQPRAGRVLAAQMFNIFFVGVIHRQTSFMVFIKILECDSQ